VTGTSIILPRDAIRSGQALTPAACDLEPLMSLGLDDKRGDGKLRLRASLRQQVFDQKGGLAQTGSPFAFSTCAASARFGKWFCRQCDKNIYVLMDN